MKRCVFLLSFLMVFSSQAIKIAADVFTDLAKAEVIEKEKTEKEADDESDVEKDTKDKIFHNSIIPLGFLATQVIQNPHPETKISSLALDKEIDPPDYKFSC